MRHARKDHAPHVQHYQSHDTVREHFVDLLPELLALRASALEALVTLVVFVVGACNGDDRERTR